MEHDESKLAPWIQAVQAAGATLVEHLSQAEEFSLAQKFTTRIQVDVGWYKPLEEATVQKMGAMGIYLVRDEPVTCAIRRLTFQAGGEPPCAPKPWSWSGPSGGFYGGRSLFPENDELQRMSIRERQALLDPCKACGYPRTAHQDRTGKGQMRSCDCAAFVEPNEEAP